jgi:hydroxymethylbilane synthase
VTEELTKTTRSDDVQAEVRRRYLSIAIDVSGLRCLVVGGGRVGTRKAVTLADAGAEVTVLAPTVSDRLAEAVKSGAILWKPGRYSEGDVDGFALVVAATCEPALNVRIGNDAESKGALSCVVSPGRCSRVIFPAVHVHAGVTVAVHSNGTDCAESRQVRDDVAAMLLQRGKRPIRLALFGAKRADLPAAVFESLANGACDALRELGILVLATCQRWECYFAEASARGAVRDIRRTVEEQCGLLLESYTSAFYTKTDAAAFHHLLRVATGLDSHLLGETEAAGQVRSAVDQWEAEVLQPGHSSRGVSDTQPRLLKQAFTSCLLAQKRLRAESGLAFGVRSWATATVSLLECRLQPLPSRRILLFGCGRLAESIARQLRAKQVEVVPFSRRAGTSGVGWRASLGLGVRHPAALALFLAGAHGIVLTSELPKEGERLLADRLCEGAFVVADLTGRYGELLRRHGGAAGTHCFRLAEIGEVPLTGADAVRVASAEKLAFEHALRWHARRTGRHWSPRTARVGGRASRLSLAQIAEAAEFLAILAPKLCVEVVTFETPGDRDKDTPLPLVSEDDFFTRDLDAAVLAGEIDLAVHSAKDLPSRVPPGLCVAALTPSFAPWEALVSRDGLRLSELPIGARVGTSSGGRRWRLAELRPDLRACDVRGSVPERLAQLDEGRYDALILATAGLIRLGLKHRMTEVFSLGEFPPAPGQGKLALVVREQDEDLRRFLEPLDLGDRRDMPWAK